MTHLKIHASKEDGHRMANTLLHHRAIQRLKSKIQQVLKLNDTHPILVGVIVEDHKTETVIMLECYQSERMKIYSIKKAPHEIEENEILALEQQKIRPKLYRLSIQ